METYICGCLVGTLNRRLHDLLTDPDRTQGKLDPKKLQLQLTGFLEKSTGMFMEELWGLLVDAQSSLGGIPSAFLQDKKQEMIQAKVRAALRALSAAKQYSPVIEVPTLITCPEVHIFRPWSVWSVCDIVFVTFTFLQKFSRGNFLR